jgi:hypothetical protein
VHDREPGKYTTVEVIRPSGAWSIPATIEELGGINLAWRSGNSPWMSHKDPLAQFKKIAPEIHNITNVLGFLHRLVAMYHRLSRRHGMNKEEAPRGPHRRKSFNKRK